MEQDVRPRVIVLTPVKNEAWILDTFLKCASFWADHIIIADQLSSDESKEIAKRFPKVTFVENPNSAFSEVSRQQVLLDAARNFPSPRVLVALDADELMSANVIGSSEWEVALRKPPGTVLGFAKVELYYSIAEYFLHSVEDKNSWIPFGYVDDGAAHEGEVIHTTRIPGQSNAPRFNLNELVVLHFARFDKLRAESKDRWYRCFERLSFPEKNTLTLHRNYDFFERLREKFKIRRTKSEWFANYEGIALDPKATETLFWWDWEVLRMFKKHGTAPFKYLDVWDVDWERLRQQGIEQGISDLPDEVLDLPLGRRERFVRWLLKWPRWHGFMNRFLWRLFHYKVLSS